MDGPASLARTRAWIIRGGGYTSRSTSRMLNSKMATMAASLEKDRPAGGEWTGYNAALERSFLDKQKYLSDKPVRAEPKPASPAAAKAVKQASGFGQAMLAAFDGTKE